MKTVQLEFDFRNKECTGDSLEAKDSQSMKEVFVIYKKVDMKGFGYCLDNCTHFITSSVYKPYFWFRSIIDAKCCLVLYLYNKKIDDYFLSQCADIRKTRSLMNILSDANIERMLKKVHDKYRVESKLVRIGEILLNENMLCDCFI